jgi:hypothetical protein
MAPGKGGDDKDNPLHFSGEIKDWPTFKEGIQSCADARDCSDTTWLLEAGRASVVSIQGQDWHHDDTEKALDREKGKTDSDHVQTSVDSILFKITFKSN